jgi:glucokinase
LLNPHPIVIGGDVAKAGERLIGTIREPTEKTFWESLEIVPATLGNDAGIIAAATLAPESELLPKLEL